MLHIEPISVIADYQLQRIIKNSNSDLYPPRSRMASYIRQSLMRNAKADGFEVRIETARNVVSDHVHGEIASLGVTLSLPSQRREQSEVIQYGRSQIKRQIPDLYEAPVEDLDILIESTDEFILTSSCTDCLQVDLCNREHLSDLIVELAGNCPTLVFLRFEETM